MKKKTLAVLQARMSSTRLPGKVMMEINGLPMIHWQIQRILEASSVDKLIVVTSTDPSDDCLAEFLEGHSITVHRGSLDNVFSRFIEVATQYHHDAIIRLTGDCPLVMQELLDKMVMEFYQSDSDYLSNTLDPTFPDGLDIEIIKHGTLERLAAFALEPKELEHVTYGVYKRPEIFKLTNFLNEIDQSALRWTVDYQEDLDFVRAIFGQFSGREKDFSFSDVCQFLQENPNLQFQNHVYARGDQLRKDENHG